MLTQLHVENFALIDTLDLEFGPGFTVLTGETGAGKSILVDAINALLGERIASDVVREGTQKAVVQGAFDISGRKDIADGIVAQGYDPDECMIIARDVSLQGKTQSRVNGRLSTLSSHRELTQLLADVHGQHEHQLLLSSKWQMAFLDGFAGPNAECFKREFREVWHATQQARAEHVRLSTDARERERLADLYRYQVREIDQAELRVGEDEELKAESVRLANVEKLSLAAAGALSSLHGDDGAPGAQDLVAQAVKALDSVTRFDPDIEDQAVSLGEALIRIEDVSEKLRLWQTSLDVSPERIDEVQTRLDLIGNLKRKYGDTISDILAYRERSADDLNALETSDERRSILETQIANLESRAKTLAGQLGEARRAVVDELSMRVERELGDLGMGGSRFIVSVEHCEMGPTGADKIEFLISANAGESPKPLARVASGGEASRVMLALKTVLSAEDPVLTLVFDEVDAGIGGRTANAVGEKLKGLAVGRQVLCVTHLAQIARFADHHYCVEKSDSDGRTIVSIRRLSDEERVNELARMLGGEKESEAALHHARELLSASASKER